MNLVRIEGQGTNLHSRIATLALRLTFEALVLLRIFFWQLTVGTWRSLKGSRRLRNHDYWILNQRDVRVLFMGVFKLFPRNESHNEKSSPFGFFDGALPMKRVILPRFVLKLPAKLTNLPSRLVVFSVLSISSLEKFYDWAMKKRNEAEPSLPLPQAYGAIESGNLWVSRLKVFEPSASRALFNLLRTGANQTAQSVLEFAQGIDPRVLPILLKDKSFEKLLVNAALIDKDNGLAKLANLDLNWKIHPVRQLTWARAKWPSPFSSSFPKNYVKSFRSFCQLQEEAVVFSGGTVMSGGDLLDTDFAQSHFFDFVAGRHDHVMGNSFNLRYAAVKSPPLSGEVIPQGILLSSRADSNWFHWLIETLPRLILVEDLDRQIPILVSQRVPIEGIELLKMLTDRSVITINQGQGQIVSKLTIPGQVIFNPDSSEFFRDELRMEFDGEILLELRRRILSAYKDCRVAYGAKLFMTRRGGARMPFGLRTIEWFFEKAGFDVLDFSEIPVEEQVLRVNGAAQIVYLGGASMANLLFCRPGTQIVCFYPRSARNFDVHDRLAGLVESKMRTIKGFDVSFLYRAMHAKGHARYLISPLMVLKSLLFFRRS